MKYQWFLILVLSIANIGCVRLGQTTLTEDLFGEQATWLDDSAEDTDQLAKNKKIQEEDLEQEKRKIADPAQQTSTKIPIKLTAEPQKKSSDQLIAVTTQPLVFSKHSLRPLNKKTSTDANLKHANSVNSLRSPGTTNELKPLALTQKPRLQPMPSKVLSPSNPFIADNGSEASSQLNRGNKLVPTSNKTQTGADQTRDKLLVFDSDQASDCPDCEAGMCETKDKKIPPENSIGITEPTFGMLSAPPLANTAFESDASPPTKLVAQNKPVTKPDIQIRQINSVQPESSTIIEYAFALPAPLKSESPISRSKGSHSNAFIPKSNREDNAELQIKNSVICSEITGFRKHKPFAENKFQPGQPFLVYCEIENYESKDKEINSDKVVQSRFQGSYQIKNRDGQLVQAGFSPIIEDNAPKRRRDFYLYFKIELNKLNPGNYQFQMEISDLNGQKKGNLEEDLLFNVR